jgi:hypothetical protein
VGESGGSHAIKAAGSELLRDAAWFPHRLDFERGVAVFTRTNRDALSAQPFLDARWERRGSASATLPLAVLADAPAPPTPPGFIWHTAFCCSTLIAACLDWPGVSLSLKEPVALADFAIARHRGDPRADAATLEGLVRLLGRPFLPGARVLIKPSNAANGLAEAVAEMGGPALLLHSGLRRFLLAVAKGGEARRGFVRQLMARWASQPDARFGPTQVALFSDLQVAALVWRLQMDELLGAARKLGPQRARFLDCDVFLTDPRATLSMLDAHFGLGLGAERIEETLRGPKLRQHAKTPRETFDADAESRDFADARSALGQELEQLEAWCAELMGPPPPSMAPVHGARLALA